MTSAKQQMIATMLMPVILMLGALAALAGDRPFLRFGNGSMGDASFMLALARAGQARWLQECSDIITTYRPSRMEWIVKDPAFGATCVTLEAVPLAEEAGMAVRVRVQGAQPGDRLI